MHAREIIVILFIILMILFGVRSYALGDKTYTRESMYVPMTEYPAHVTSNDSLGIDPVTLANTQNNKYVAPVQVPMASMPMQRKKKNVSFAPQKEVAMYSKRDGDIKDIVVTRM